MTDTPPTDAGLGPLQKSASALAVLVTALVTLDCTGAMAGRSFQPRELIYLPLLILPVLVFGAGAWFRRQPLDVSIGQLAATLGVAAWTIVEYLSVAYHTGHRSSTEGLVFIAVPFGGFPLGGLLYVLVAAGARRFIWRGPQPGVEGEAAAAEAPGGAVPVEERLDLELLQRWILSNALLLGLPILGGAFGLVLWSLHEGGGRKAEAKPPTPAAYEALARLGGPLDADNPSNVELAKDPSSPPRLLCELAELAPRPESSEWAVRMWVEGNPSTPPPVAAALASLHPARKYEIGDYLDWPKESQPDCAQFATDADAATSLRGAHERSGDFPTPLDGDPLDGHQLPRQVHRVEKH